MARFDDGELSLEVEDATPEQAQRALAAARRTIAKAGASVTGTIAALTRRASVLDQEMAWEAGNGPEPTWLTDEDNELADLGEDAETAASVKAGGRSCRLGLLEPRAPQHPALRDLFEPA